MPRTVSRLALSPWIRQPNLARAIPCLNGDTLLLTKDGGLLDASLTPLALNPVIETFCPVSEAQRLPDGGIALVIPRAETGEPNLFVYDGSRNLQFAFPVGDGVNHMTVDRQGRFWIGYFDEGIFSEDPLSSQGLVAFAPDGKPCFGLHDNDAGAPYVSDCYALTLDAAGKAWFCAYDTFELGYIDGETYRRVTTDTPAPGAKGLLVDDRYIAYLGGYDMPDEVTVFDMWTTRASVCRS